VIPVMQELQGLRRHRRSERNPPVKAALRERRGLAGSLERLV
jgi:hypothetical protein